MHSSSHKGMGELLAAFWSVVGDREITVLDIGSLDVNGTYRDKMPPHWKYIGADLRDGPNVDVCMDGEFEIPLESESVDLVISGQCLEHCRNPFKLVAEAARILKRGGTMFLVAPFVFVEHKEPIDCWRFLPDGMRAIFDGCELETVDAYVGAVDCWGIGRKPCA